MECSGVADDGLFQQVLGLDELALILQAVGRAERGVAGLCAAGVVRRGLDEGAHAGGEQQRAERHLLQCPRVPFRPR